MKLNIAVLPGDGIGPEISVQGVEVIVPFVRNLDMRFTMSMPFVALTRSIR